MQRDAQIEFVLGEVRNVWLQMEIGKALSGACEGTTPLLGYVSCLWVRLQHLLAKSGRQIARLLVGVHFENIVL